MSMPVHVQNVSEVAIAKEMEKPMTTSIAFEVDTEGADKRFEQAESLLVKSIAGLSESLKTHADNPELLADLKLANENLDTIRKARSQAAITAASQIVSPKSETKENVNIIKITESKGDEKKMSEIKTPEVVKSQEAILTPHAAPQYLTPDPSASMPQAPPPAATAGDSDKPTGVAQSAAPAPTVENIPPAPVEVKAEVAPTAPPVASTPNEGGPSPAPVSKPVPVPFPKGTVPIKGAAEAPTTSEAPPVPEEKMPDEVAPVVAPPADAAPVELAPPEGALTQNDIMGTFSMSRGAQESKISSIRRVISREGILPGKLPVAPPDVNESVSPKPTETRSQPRPVIRTPSMYQEHAMPLPMVSDIFGHKQDAIVGRAREIMEQYGMNKEKAKAGWLVVAKEILEHNTNQVNT